MSNLDLIASGVDDAAGAEATVSKQPVLPQNTFKTVCINSDMANFAGKTRRTRPKLSVQNYCAADTGANHHVKNIAAAAAGSTLYSRIAAALASFSSSTRMPVARMNSA